MNSSEPGWHERSLHRAVLAGDENAWRSWYDESFAGLQAYVLWRCAGLRDLADEVVQETWLTAVRRIRHFEPGRGTFGDWLRGIAGNVLRNSLRARARRGRQFQSLNGHDLPVAPEPTEQKRDQAERLARALAALAPQHEAVLRAKYLEQQAVADIAAARDETPKAVESMLSRARQAFRDAYEHPEDDSRGR